ncbi:hypothetical protein [Dyadobacter frigoris]|uniref:Uncharacterized protein n=1 Tax=Dyadobacter frigoris TaxID=2576211 RepID=A0A4U6D2T9_9BACT|nr:hypothetical protein [Dyadobacter frigoris]TKT90645.1 hypothetical protein FDK13_20205 [Dyadobacter frigoris]GLU51202.1 hypothetical protein Dfri01_06630 [Dyadobacter frigoris]
MKHLFKNIFRFAAISIAFFAIVLLCIHFWFKYNSERTIEQLISWGSGGKLKCSIGKIETNYFHNAIHVEGISIFTVNSSNQSTSYKFNVKDFHFRTRSRWDLFVHRQLLIDSIVFNSPEIVIGKRVISQTDSTNKIALLDDLEKLYSSIYKSLNVLNLQLFKINEGKLIVRNEDNPSKPPLVVSHIHFSINKLKIGSSHRKDSSQFIFSERVMLRIADQKIMLPDNKSNVSFKELLIDSKDKLVRLSGAAVRIYPSLNQRNSTDIRARKLSILGLDFNLLYQKQLVKADSVFLENPFITSELFIGGKARKSGNDKKALFDSTLNQLPVAFNIGHVIMQKGGVATNLHQGGKITRFSAANDNVSISGFHLNDSGKKELKIGGFHYTVRNYTGFLPDSILQLKFDSLQFINDKIVLHNLIASTPRNRRNKVLRDYVIPRFEVTGMDWLAFIFHNNFKARDAVLYQPILRSEQNVFLTSMPAGKAKRSIYQNLSLMDKIIDLEKLRIVDGDLSLKQGSTLELRLQNLNLSVHVGKLGKARSPGELVRSIKQLSFGTAAVTTPSVIVTTGPSVFNEIGQKLVFDSIRVDTKNGDIGGTFKKVEVQDFSFENNQLDISRLQWEEGSVSVDAASSGAAIRTKSNRTLWFFIEQMSGNNTKLHFKGNGVKAEVNLENLSANKISREKGSSLQTEGLRLMGTDASINTPSGVLQLGDFDIGDKENSTVRDIVFRRQNPGDTILVDVPVLGFKPYLEKTLLTKRLTLDSVSVNQPRILFSAQRRERKDTISLKSAALPNFNIHEFFVRDGYFLAGLAGDSTVVKRISISAKSIATQLDSSLLAERISVDARAILLSKNSGERADADGDLSAELDHFKYHPGLGTWAVQLDKFKTNRIGFKRNKAEKHTRLSLERLKIEDLTANQTDLDQGLSWFINRSGARLQLDSLSLQTEKSFLGLGQLRFDGKGRQLTMRSFSLNPAVSRSDFYEGRVYRKIYLTTQTGEIQVNGLELKKEGLQMSYVGIDNSALTIYADKLKKFGPPIIQPLPVAALAKIGFPFQIDEIWLRNARVHYTELNPVSKDTGSVNFSSINASIRNVSSNRTVGADSLHVKVSALFLDKMQLQVAMSQSYRDTLGGLRLDIELGPGKFTELNPFLAPLLSARARSGYLDSMRMTAVGNDYISKGFMNLHYHNLKADLLDSGKVDKQKFRTRLIGFFANKIAIRNSNTKKEASFIFVRNRQKPVIVYFLRMVVGGCAGSIAPISNVFFRKQYKRAIKNVPKHTELVL